MIDEWTLPELLGAATQYQPTIAEICDTHDINFEIVEEGHAIPPLKTVRDYILFGFARINDSYRKSYAHWAAYGQNKRYNTIAKQWSKARAFQDEVKRALEQA